MAQIELDSLIKLTILKWTKSSKNALPQKTLIRITLFIYLFILFHYYLFFYELLIMWTVWLRMKQDYISW